MNSIIKILLPVLLLVCSSRAALGSSYPQSSYKNDTSVEEAVFVNDAIVSNESPFQQELFASDNDDNGLVLLGMKDPPPDPGNPAPIGEGLYVSVLFILLYGFVRYKRERVMV